MSVFVCMWYYRQKRKKKKKALLSDIIQYVLDCLCPGVGALILNCIPIFSAHFQHVLYHQVNKAFSAFLCRSKQQTMVVLRSLPQLGCILSGSAYLPHHLHHCSSMSWSTILLSWRMIRWLRLWVLYPCNSDPPWCGLKSLVKFPF